MSLTSKLQAEARTKFALVVSAFAYTYIHNGQKGLRVEAPDIVKEYTDGVLLGRDPKGLLFFHALRPDFNEDREVKYKVSFPSQGDGVDKEVVIVVDFLRPTSTDPFAKFIATLPQRAHKDAVPFEGGGGSKSHWRPFEATQATTRGTKDSTSDEVVLDAVSLKKRFTFSVPKSESQKHHTMGYSLITNFKDLKAGVTYFVDYTNTRVMVFEKQYDENPVAVFGSYELQKDYQLFDADFQIQNGKFTDLAV